MLCEVSVNISIACFVRRCEVEVAADDVACVTIDESICNVSRMRITHASIALPAASNAAERAADGDGMYSPTTPHDTRVLITMS